VAAAVRTGRRSPGRRKYVHVGFDENIHVFDDPAIAFRYEPLAAASIDCPKELASGHIEERSHKPTINSPPRRRG
jgi:hypothetical protein